MHTLVSIIVPSRGRSDQLQRLVDALATQQLRRAQSFELIVVIDGDGSPPSFPQGLCARTISVGFGGAGNARNVGVEHAKGDILLFLNDDVVPCDGFVQAHVDAIKKGHLAVLGQSPWGGGFARTLFDEFITHTPSIFDAGSLVPFGLHDFRSAWTLNLSIRRSAIRDQHPPFDREIRPVYFEDLEFAYRCFGDQPIIYHEPKALAVHHHRVCIEEYFKREVLLGMMSAVLYHRNQPCHDRIFAQSPEEHARASAPMLPIDAPDHRRILKAFTDLARTRAGDVVDPIEQAKAMYIMHLPIKRRAFRLGLCAFINDGPIAWDQRIPRAAELLAADPVFSTLVRMETEHRIAEHTHAQ